MDASKQNIGRLIDESRKTISEYCLSRCNYSCCANRFPLKTKNPSDVRALFELDDSVDLDEFAKTKPELHTPDFILQDKEYHITLDPCPQLEGKICKLYNNPARPMICKQYPIMKTNNRILLFSECSAIKNGLISDYYQRFRDEGYDLLILDLCLP